MRPLGDRISGGRRGARGFGSSPRNYRSGLLLPGIGSRCPSLGDFSPRDNAEHSSRAHGGATVRRTRSTLKGTPLLRIDSTSPNESLDSDFAGLIGTIRRECLDRVIIIGERHRQTVLENYFEYYHHSRPHRSLAQDSPVTRPELTPEQGRVVEFPQVGGRHHLYTREAA